MAISSSLSKAYTIKINNFEGPMDLLFHLVEKNKMDVYDIQISEITQQYLEYLSEMQNLNLEIASEFVVMAATLLQIKSRLLLPNINTNQDNEDDGLDIDPKEQLVRKLIEYKKMKIIADQLKDREHVYSKMFYRGWLYINKTPCTLNCTIAQLKDAYNSVVFRYRNRVVDVSTNMIHILRKEPFSVKVKMQKILAFLSDKISFRFKDLFKHRVFPKAEIIANFLAVLELVKIRKATFYQQEVFDDIFVHARQGQEESEKLEHELTS